MMLCREREQLKQKTKEVQLFKVTKTTVQPSRERKKDHDLLEKYEAEI